MPKQAITKKNNAVTYIRLTDFEKHTVNPFARDLVQDMTVRHKRKYLRSENGKASMVVMQPETGEITAQAQFYDVEEVDESQFIKVFTHYLSAQAGLSITGRQVLTYIMTLLKPKEDTVFIRNDHALFFLGYKTRKSLLIGLGDLLEKGVIAKTQFEDEFYINPLIMFNGDRIAYAKVFVKKQSETAKKIAEDPNQMNLFDFKPNPSFQAVQKQYNAFIEHSDKPSAPPETK